jgi:hypothetical protein
MVSVRTLALAVVACFAFALPAPAQTTHTLSGTVFGGGSALPNTIVEALDDGTTTVAAETTTNAQGSYGLALADGTYDLRVTPPAGSGFGQETLQNVVMSGADRSFDVVLLSASNGVVTGVVRGRAGAAVPNASISVFNQNSGQFVGSTASDQTGRYTVASGNGTVRVSASGFNLPNTPRSWSWQRQNLAVTGSTQLNIDLDVVELTGVVTNTAGAALPSASIEASTFNHDFNIPIFRNSSINLSSDANGSYSLLLLAGTASFTVRPPAGSASTPLSQSNIGLAADQTRDFALPDAVLLSGTVRGRNGQVVVGAGISAFDQSSGQFLGSASTNDAGQYTIGVSPGAVRVSASGFNLPNTPRSWSWQRQNVPVAGSTQLDIDLNVVEIMGTVTDSNGAGVPNVSIEASTFNHDFNIPIFRNSSVTLGSDTAGRYSILLLAGAGSFTVRPPAQSGFTPASLSGVSLAGDLTQRIILQRPDLSPPDIVAGPVVIHLSDTSVSIGWTTNEPATSRVEYGIGDFTSSISDNALVTQHLVTLEGLIPTAAYDFRVSSTDGSGNGPVTSPPGTFSTQAAPGDITAPAITAGPTVVFTGQTTAIIQWTTDEPASTSAAYGETSALGSLTSLPGGFRVQHSITLMNLQPDRDYFAALTSADPDGNSTTSSIVSFRTQAVPDTTAPRITAGPTVVDSTDTKITITWTTDEPSTSGVSYNDGTQFFVVTESALVRQHEITLSSLTPQTTYSITVSSIDAVGNGPTLGGPLQAQTDAAPDTTAPGITDLAISDITETTAVVSWTTSEPATTTVAFGTTSGNLDDVRASLTPTTSHRVVLTGLRDGTTYYFVVRSSDAADNRAESNEVSFQTVPSFIDMPPSAPGPISAPAGPTRAESFTIAWGASTDDLGVTGYEVIRDGEVVAFLAGDVTSYTETGLAEGSHSYVIRASDVAGHTAASEAVTVVIDRTAPELTVPADITAEANGTAALVVFEVSATDNHDGPSPVACTAPSGVAFPVGRTVVECMATDAAGNEARKSFAIVVRDVMPPSIRVPADQLVETTSSAGVAVSFEATASDVVDGALPVTCSPASGSTFPIGLTTVQCSARDAAGNEATASFTVEISISIPVNRPPTALCRNTTVIAAVDGTGTASVDGGSFDADGDALTLVQVPAGPFVLGQTRVILSVTDPHGASTSCEAAVTVLRYGLRAAYGFEEPQGTGTAFDSTPLQNHGALNGPERTAGRFGWGMRFDGLDDMIDVADSNSLDLTRGTTLMAWVQADDQGGWRTILMKERQDGLAYALYSNNGAASAGHPVGYVRTGGADRPVVAQDSATSGRWMHIAMTFGAGKMRMYVNGVLERMETAAGTMPVSDRPLRMGGNTVWPDEFFSGVMDEVRVYDRSLSEVEIRHDMNAPVVFGSMPPLTAPTDLVAAYNFDDGTATDVSGHGHHGAVTGAVPAAGLYGQALSFDGINDLVEIAGTDDLDFTSSMTIEAWVYPTALGSKWRTAVLKQGTSGLVYGLYANNGGGKRPAAYARMAGVDRTAPSLAGALPLNVWTHVVATYDKAEGRLVLWVNGVKVGQDTVALDIEVSSGALFIGGNTFWGEYFAGLIDGVRLYNRALNLVEIQTNMLTPPGR